MADYPREIYLDSDTEERLRSLIEEELENHLTERGPHIEDLMSYQRDYWAEPTQKVRTFPFRNAANIVVPLSAIAVEAVHARAETTFFALPQVVSAQSISPEWEEAERPIERFLDNELTVSMKFRKPMGDCFLEAEKYGTMIGKVGYEKLVKRAVRTIGDTEEEFDVTVRDGARFDCVADARFLMPHHASDPQTSPWCGEEHSATPYEVMMMEQAGLFRSGTIIGDDSNLHAWITRGQLIDNRGGEKFEQSQQELENTKPVYPKRIQWFELWMAFDVDQSGTIPKEIVVHYHRDSQTFMSIRYNYHSDLRRPYRTGVYFPVEHRWRGIGICKMNAQFQKEITIQHRQRLDNATLANIRMIKISKLSGYGPNEPIFPGKMWFLDDMDHLDTVQLGEIYPSSYANEQSTLIYSQQRSGVNETILGMPQAGTPGTATSELARIQEGSKKFDLVFGRYREFGSEIITDVGSCIQQFGPRNLTYYMTAENGRLVRDFFQMPATLISEGLLIRFRSSGQHHNRVIERQDWIQLAGLIQQYYTNLDLLAQQIGDPTIRQTIMLKGMAAATEAMRQIFETYDVRNIDRMLVREIEGTVNRGLTAIGNGNGGSTQPPGTNANPPMDQLSQAFAALTSLGGGSPNRLQRSI